MQPLAIHHVSINVSNFDTSFAFYTEVLGGTARTDRPDFGFGGAWINFGSEQVRLIEAPVPGNLGQHFAIQVADIRATIEELRAKGLTVSDAIPVATNLQAFLEDPCGNAIELHEVGGA